MTIEAGAPIAAADVAVASDGTPGTLAANFTGTAVVRTALEGKLIYVNLSLVSTNAITATGGNIADTTVYTLDTPFRPDEGVQCIFGNGVTDGQATINTSGTVQIRTSSATITAGAAVTISATYMKA